MNLLPECVRDADAARRSQGFKSSSEIDATAGNVELVVEDIGHVDTNAKGNPIGPKDPHIARYGLPLDFNGRPNRIRCAWELGVGCCHRDETKQTAMISHDGSFDDVRQKGPNTNVCPGLVAFQKSRSSR